MCIIPLLRYLSKRKVRMCKWESHNPANYLTFGTKNNQKTLDVGFTSKVFELIQTDNLYIDDSLDDFIMIMCGLGLGNSKK